MYIVGLYLVQIHRIPFTLYLVPCTGRATKYIVPCTMYIVQGTYKYERHDSRARVAPWYLYCTRTMYIVQYSSSSIMLPCTCTMYKVHSTCTMYIMYYMYYVPVCILLYTDSLFLPCVLSLLICGAIRRISFLSQSVKRAFHLSHAPTLPWERGMAST